MIKHECQHYWALFTCLTLFPILSSLLLLNPHYNFFKANPIVSFIIQTRNLKQVFVREPGFKARCPDSTPCFFCIVPSSPQQKNRVAYRPHSCFKKQSQARKEKKKTKNLKACWWDSFSCSLSFSGNVKREEVSNRREHKLILEYKCHEGRNLCLFCSLFIPGTRKCLAHSLLRE